MAIQQTKNNYELAFHLLPEIEGGEVATKAKEVEDIIVRNGGSILRSQEAKRKHLSYPIRQKHYALFGFFDFTAPADAIEKINDQMKLQGDVLRYVVIKKGEHERILRSITPAKKRTPAKTQEAEALAKKTEKKAAEPEQMEKQLEEVIEKL